MEKIQSIPDLMIHIVKRIERLEEAAFGEKTELPPLDTEAKLADK